MSKSQSILKFRPIARPKYKEEISGNEAAIHQPWEIMLMVKPSELDPATYPYYVYIRAGAPDQAAMMAHQLWVQWEKKDKGLEFSRYPDVEDLGAGQGMSEDQFQEKWKEAQNYSYRYVGMRENPSAFAFMKPGQDGKSKASIIVTMPG